jgi:hypothetical protein
VPAAGIEPASPRLKGEYKAIVCYTGMAEGERVERSRRLSTPVRFRGGWAHHMPGPSITVPLVAVLQVNANSWPVHRCSECHDPRWPRACGCDPAYVQDGHRWVVTVFPLFMSIVSWPSHREHVFHEDWFGWTVNENGTRARWPA